MPKRYGYDYDLIVLGSGAGGGVAAHQAVAHGKKVALFEPAEIGGECPNWGCVPTKALLHAAHIYQATQQAADYGIKVGKTSVNYKQVKAWKDLAVSRTGTEQGQELLEEDGIKVIREFARFLGPHTITAAGQRYTARRILIATGTHPAVPPIPGLANFGYLTHKEAVDLKELPRSLFIIGGGPIGSEFAQLFSDFGVDVTIAEAKDRLIPIEDAEVGQLAEAVFTDRGINVLTGSQITRVSRKGERAVVHYVHQGVEHTKLADAILVAAGMQPNTDIGLENASVEYDRHGIKANRFMQTSTKHIYVAGDVVGPYQFTHTASYQSRIAAHNMFHRKRRKMVSYQAIPRCVFISPEAAATGLTETMARQRNIRLRRGGATVDMIGRANTADEFTGFVKVLVDADTNILVGASVVAPRAGELIHELTLAIQLGATVSQVAQTIHAFPTFSEAVKLACLDAS